MKRNSQPAYAATKLPRLSSPAANTDPQALVCIARSTKSPDEALPCLPRSSPVATYKQHPPSLPTALAAKPDHANVLRSDSFPATKRAQHCPAQHIALKCKSSQIPQSPGSLLASASPTYSHSLSLRLFVLPPSPSPSPSLVSSASSRAGPGWVRMGRDKSSPLGLRRSISGLGPYVNPCRTQNRS